MVNRVTAVVLVAWMRGADRYRARRDDRGDALSTAAIAVGLVLLAGVVIAILRNKGQSIANNVCTNADPTTCK